MMTVLNRIKNLLLLLMLTDVLLDLSLDVELIYKEHPLFIWFVVILIILVLYVEIMRFKDRKINSRSI
jgi:phosphoglycerol transferase MdoB-like AlkP superfamily enzyme